MLSKLSKTIKKFKSFFKKKKSEESNDILYGTSSILSLHYDDRSRDTVYISPEHSENVSSFEEKNIVIIDCYSIGTAIQIKFSYIPPIPNDVAVTSAISMNIDFDNDIKRIINDIHHCNYYITFSSGEAENIFVDYYPNLIKID